MLKALVTHPRQPLSRDKLMELARGREFERFDRSIDVQISRLRKMIEDDPAQPRYIQTVWGVGYVFVPDGTNSPRRDVHATGFRSRCSRVRSLLISALLVLSQLIWLGLYRTYNVRAQSRVPGHPDREHHQHGQRARWSRMPAPARRHFSEKLPVHQNIRLFPATAWDDEEVARCRKRRCCAAISDHLKRDSRATPRRWSCSKTRPTRCGSRSRSSNQAYWVVFPPIARLGFGLGVVRLEHFRRSRWQSPGGYLLMLRVNRPLRALAAAAEQIGAGQDTLAAGRKRPSAKFARCRTPSTR